MGSMQRPDTLGIFKKTDSDRSGGVSQAELKNLADVFKEKTGKIIDISNDSFKTYDSNSDGTLSGDELKSVLDNSGFGPPQGMQEMGPPPGGKAGAPQSPPPPADSRSSSSETASLTQIFDEMDTNEDGTVSARELAAALESESGSSSSSNTASSLQDQIKELNNILKTLTKYADSSSSSSNSIFSTTS